MHTRRLRRRARWGVATLAALLVPATATAYAPAEQLCVLDHPEIRESSGVVASRHSDGVFFTHNDSGDGPRLFAFDPSCRVLATITVEGAAASDWEDIGGGTGRDGAPALFIGDIGNNGRTRADLVVYEIPEPVVEPGTIGQSLSVGVAASYPFVYDDGPQDAESLFVDPRTGNIVIVGKTFTGVGGVYVLERMLPEPLPLVARTIAFIPFLSTRAIAPQATGADIAPDGTRIVVRTYQEAFEWTVTGDLASTFRALPRVIPLPPTFQGEAIAYTRDGTGLVTTTEGSGPVHYVGPDQTP